MRLRFVLGVAVLSASVLGCKSRTSPPSSSSAEGAAASAPSGVAGVAGIGDRGGSVTTTGALGAVGGPPKLTEAEARALVAKASAEATKPNGDCKSIIASAVDASRVIQPTTPEAKAVFRRGATCAETRKDFRLMLGFASALSAADPQAKKHGLAPRALAGLGRTEEAFKELNAAEKQFPNEPEIAYAATLVAERQRAWANVVKYGDRAIQRATGATEPGMKQIAWDAPLTQMNANLHLGSLEKAEANVATAEKNGAPAPIVASIRKALVPAKATKVMVKPMIPDRMWLGTYHFYGKGIKEVGDAMTLEIFNFTGKDATLKVEVEIPGVTEKLTKTVNLLKGQTEAVQLTPPFATAFKIGELASERQSQVNVKVSLADKTVFEDARSVKLYPRDQVPAWINPAFYNGWVTPQAQEVEQLLTAAKKRHPRGSLSGNLDATVPQMKAIYDELKARGMSYVLVTDFGKTADGQHARLPADTIKSTNALCLDGTLLFATMAEKLGLEPVMVRIPGHIFMGWRATPKDAAPPGTVFFLETTMIGSAPFEAAMRKGEEEYAEQVKLKNFENHQSMQLDVIKLRKDGYTAQPW